MQFDMILHPIRWLFLSHAFAGALALFVFLVPLLSKKGGELHIKSGWVYTYSMIFVGLSALVITPWRMFFDPSRTLASSDFAIFLLYISVFTLSSLVYGLNALKEKKRRTPSKKLKHLFPPTATILLGIGIQCLGLKHGNSLLMVFPCIGHFTSVSQLMYWLKSPQEKMHGWYAHMQGMIVACIATITAFLVTALPRLWPSLINSQSLIPWIAPGVILGTVLNRWTAFLKKKYEK